MIHPKHWEDGTSEKLHNYLPVGRRILMVWFVMLPILEFTLAVSSKDQACGLLDLPASLLAEGLILMKKRYGENPIVHILQNAV